MILILQVTEMSQRANCLYLEGWSFCGGSHMMEITYHSEMSPLLSTMYSQICTGILNFTVISVYSK